MMLTEITPVVAGALPVQMLKDHLRLGTGFADADDQNPLLEMHLRASIAAIESRIGKALLTRQFQLVLEDWRGAADQPFPLAPVGAVLSVTMSDGYGGNVIVGADRYRLVPDLHRPRLVATGTALPTVASGGRIEVVFEAGFGETWNAVPSDLGQAVLMLAAEYYEHRQDAGLRTTAIPFGVVSLIDRWRTVRVLGGRAS